ncbi:DNA-binding response regulator [Bacillus thuringiensis]|uniref:response regulator transcription factor n=1 Tax=Bacillus thuringiensis TaxID=1428 RepID=UPI000BEC3574|nr:response regulator transcription factor [Bacillus thuringiensis]MED3056201.1 response regulator transcription factor [Bacillus thuringiensis]MED3687036.1 response regulator transcription factor [Bacillus thuringiensis]PDX91814.1 DNA-binding response regulator [Bacillus thuringiensis]PES43529.1 DNA-binding response regulator [Bacillus thuringiensis]PEV51333.1 DNA-binding response regulator [Bacillus thuringiensis]
MDKVLFVEDDNDLGMAIEFTLKGEGLEVIRVSTVQDAKDQYENNKFDLAILDVGLPDGNGYDLCTYLKRKGDIPIIFLTALDEEANVVMGLDIGGDDYITKPFRVKELLSRVKVQLRKKIKTASNTILRSENIHLEVEAARAFKHEKSINLTHLEYKLLLTLMLNPHKVLQRNEILKKIVDESEVFFDENTLSVYVKRLRSKIEDNPQNPDCIITQRGVGYFWNKDVSKE